MWACEELHGHLQVGGFCMMFKEDLKRVAPLWLQYSKDVRHDPNVSPYPTWLLLACHARRVKMVHWLRAALAHCRPGT